MGFDVSMAGCHISDRNVDERQKTKGVDEAKMVQNTRSHLRRHGQGNEGRRQHQYHIDLSEKHVAWRTFAPDQLDGTDEKCGTYCCQMQIGKLCVGHTNTPAFYSTGFLVFIRCKQAASHRHGLPHL